MMVSSVKALHSVTKIMVGLIGRAMPTLAFIACLLYLFGTWPLVLTGFRLQVFSRQEPFRLATQAVTGNAIVIQETPSALGLDPSDLVHNPPSMEAAGLYALSCTHIGALRK